MELQKVQRKRTKIKMALQGPSGSGKTYSALLLAYGLCSAWDKIAIIDTENFSSELYSNLGDYNVLPIIPPFTPEKYVQAIKKCEQAGIKVIIIDSITHEWDGIGGILDIHSAMAGNSFTNWSKLTPRHNAFVQTLLQSPTHTIATIRSKQDYVLVEKNGKQVPEKVGLKGITRDGMDYEFTLVFNLDIKHFASTTKDRTGLFITKPEFIITPEIGKKIAVWCSEGIEINEDVKTRIKECKSLGELIDLYKGQPSSQKPLLEYFLEKKSELTQSTNSIVSPEKISSNGSSNKP